MLHPENDYRPCLAKPPPHGQRLPRKEPSRPALQSLCVLLACLAASLLAGCFEGPAQTGKDAGFALLAESRSPRACASGDSVRQQPAPFHTLSIDGQNGFSAAERLPLSGAGAKGMVTWDACQLFLGYSSAALGSRCDAERPSCTPGRQSGSPHRVLAFYLNTDPLRRDGTVHPRRAHADGPLLPFRADYLIEVRTDGRMVETTSGEQAYRGNAQVFENIDEWETGLVRGWKPLGRAGLEIAHRPEHQYLELGIDWATFGDPCAIEVVAWVTDTRSGERSGYWPAPDSAAQPAGTASLNYYGFPLVRHVRPDASTNLNRIDYDAAGVDCARGDEGHQ